MDQSAVPQRRLLKHETIRDHVRALVSHQAPGTPAPSERELVHQFNVARMTVRQALEALVVEGLLERVPGRGTFVAHPRRRTTPVLSFSEEMSRRGRVVGSRTLAARREGATESVAKALGIPVGENVVYWRRLRIDEGGPLCIVEAWLNDALLSGFLNGPLPSSLYAELAKRGLRPTWAEDIITVADAAGDEADLLEVPPDSLVVRGQRRAYSGEAVVEVSRAAHRVDRYQLRLQLSAPA